MRFKACAVTDSTSNGAFDDEMDSYATSHHTIRSPYSHNNNDSSLFHQPLLRLGLCRRTTIRAVFLHGNISRYCAVEFRNNVVPHTRIIHGTTTKESLKEGGGIICCAAWLRRAESVGDSRGYLLPVGRLKASCLSRQLEPYPRRLLQRMLLLLLRHALLRLLCSAPPATVDIICTRCGVNTLLVAYAVETLLLSCTATKWPSVRHG